MSEQRVSVKRGSIIRGNLTTKRYSSSRSRSSNSSSRSNSKGLWCQRCRKSGHRVKDCTLMLVYNGRDRRVKVGENDVGVMEEREEGHKSHRRRHHHHPHHHRQDVTYIATDLADDNEHEDFRHLPGIILFFFFINLF